MLTMRIDDQFTLQSGGGDNVRLRDLHVRAALVNDSLSKLSALDRLRHMRREIDGRIVFTIGFGLDGQVIFHLLAENNIDIDLVTIDTGRLFPETYRLWEATERRYGRKILGIRPRPAAVASYVREHGVDGFYDSKEARLSCCFIRKVEPLERELAGAAAWVTGLRAEQSVHRAAAGFASADAARGLIKINPLFDWTREQVLDFARRNDVPINALHARGYASIGCEPCTRAIRPGESERAGRWWWEDSDKKECGLHLPSRSRDADSPAIHNAGC
jgi:phosphoadenosine phosphosulfate reductase